MAIKIFATGATGYIGGSVLSVIIAAHPEYSVTALVRSASGATALKKKHPNMITVLGDLDSLEILKTESQKADIILNFANNDHVPSALAITSALAALNKPTFLIHTSGSAILADISARTSFGAPLTPEQEYADISTLAAITSFPEPTHPHRDVDVVILAAGEGGKVKTAIVCPPCIYGVGLGTGNTSSSQIPGLARRTLERRKGFVVQGGKNQWNNVHIRDLSSLFLLLVEAAAAGGGTADWGREGYYFAENGVHVWGDVARRIAGIAKRLGYITTDEVDDLTADEADAVHEFGAVLWGTNSLGKAERAREKLGWVPVGVELEETLEEAVEIEAKKLGLKKA